MPTQEELDAASSFFEDCNDPYGKRIDSELAPRVQAFLAQHPDRPLAVVTSGGTTVPLERRCVRFIDNFSAGHRGALSTEQFLEAGYVVIHLHRDSAVEPFTQGLPASSLLGLLKAAFVLEQQGGEVNHGHQSVTSTSSQGDGVGGHEKGVACGPEGTRERISVRAEAQSQIAECLKRAQSAEAQHALLIVEFQNLFEYLQSLRCIATAVNPLGPRALFYLAAAVSDFYVPWSELAEHKIQSSGGPLQLTLQKVPKMLGMLSGVWVPSSMVISFKLETDPGMLVRKAFAALSMYRVDAVIANLLHTRKDRVLLVTPSHLKPPQPASAEDSSAAASLQSETVGGAVAGGQHSEINSAATLQKQQQQQRRHASNLTTRVREQQDLTEQQAVASLAQGGEGQTEEMGVDTEVIDRLQEEPYIERQLVLQVVAKHKIFMALRRQDSCA